MRIDLLLSHLKEKIMDRMLSFGSVGSDVSALQTALNMHPPTQLPPLNIDSIFGLKTSARVKEFQRNNGLQIDGIVGPNTWTKLRALQPQVVPQTGVSCGNGDPGNQGKALFISNAFVSSFANEGVYPSLGDFLRLPSFIRPLAEAQISIARGVYGFSLDYSRIFISNQIGLEGRAFTVVVPATLVSPAVQIMNCGTFEPHPITLIHELAHVWQSQHHWDPAKYLWNAVESQGAAVAMNEAEGFIDNTLKSNSDFPVKYPFSAYAFIPGKPFGEYAAEQIAKAVELGVGDIVSHVKSVGIGKVDGPNVNSLITLRVGDRRISGTIN